MWAKLDARTRERLEKQVREKLEANEFLRARMQSGKLTSESPDWLNTRRELLRETLSKTNGKSTPQFGRTSFHLPKCGTWQTM